MTADDIQIGKWYRAKQPRIARTNEPNDRYVLHVGNTSKGVMVQYDGPAVPMGSHYPSVTMEKFLAWAGCECEEPESYR